MTCLNPCCSGRWSSTKGELNKNVADYVLILVVVEDGLVPEGDITTFAKPVKS